MMERTSAALVIFGLVAACGGTGSPPIPETNEAPQSFGTSAIKETAQAYHHHFCSIGGVKVPGGTIDPADHCLSCDAIVNAFGWTAVPGCVPTPGAQGCDIGGNTFGNGAANPANSCQICAPASSTTAWTNSLDGKPCATGTCQAGTCTAPSAGSGCTIGGKSFADGDLSPTNICLVCDPSASTSAWSNFADGAACGTGMACFSGVCTSHFPNCTIEGVSVAPNAASPTNACALCQPRQSETAWTNAPDGSSCGGGRQCFAGQCE